MKKLDLKFIHIGKCGGTTTHHNFKLNKYHLKRNYKKNETYLIWIRNPIKRFVSAFNYVKSVINTNISNINAFETVCLDNCLAPPKIINKIKKS